MSRQRSQIGRAFRMKGRVHFRGQIPLYISPES